jgi:serine/threonine protein phosphatase PrpC
MTKNHGWLGCLKKITKMQVQPVTLDQHDISRLGPQSESIRGAVNKSNCLTHVLQPAHTLRLRPDPEELYLSEIPSCTRDPQPMTWHGITDRGIIRDHNEDTFSILALGDNVMFVVADGMGGHDAGEVASRIAVDAVCSEVYEGVNKNKDLVNLVEHAMQKANTEVRREGANKGSNMGTTISVALVDKSTAYIGSVGDSRVYWIENGSITQVTEDHSLVAKLVSAGKLTREEARIHPRSNLLYRTIGTDEIVKIDTFRTPLGQGGTLLLCTDGLWGDITDANIHQVCAEARDAKTASERLVQMANENGGKDNITAIVVKIA